MLAHAEKRKCHRAGCGNGPCPLSTTRTTLSGTQSDEPADARTIKRLAGAREKCREEGGAGYMSKGSERVKRSRRLHPDRARDVGRKTAARKGGYLPPALKERDCRPRPSDNRCDLCMKPTVKFHFDHDHHTGAFRGWTCPRCNIMLGNVESVGLSEISDYLSRKLPWL
jgi:hypothetical protein